jgi:hypothetical protein
MPRVLQELCGQPRLDVIFRGKFRRKEGFKQTAAMKAERKQHPPGVSFKENA